MNIPDEVFEDVSKAMHKQDWGWAHIIDLPNGGQTTSVHPPLPERVKKSFLELLESAQESRKELGFEEIRSGGMSITPHPKGLKVYFTAIDRKFLIED